ncbi:holin [Candidatus Omnitrophota bacterium]
MEGLFGFLGVEGLTLSGVAIVAIPFLVNLIKKIKWIGSKFAPIVAFVLGAIIGVIGYLTGIVPDGMTMFQAIVLGLTLGGTSTGLYDLNKKVILNQ